MRKHILKLTLALFTVFCCTACFDIQENVYFRKDGSGNFSFLVDLQEMKSMMSMFNDPANEKDKTQANTSPYEKINNNFEESLQKLNEIKGISNARSIEDTIAMRFGISFDFKNIGALNKAMNRFFEDDTTKNVKKETVYFEWNGNQLIRHEDLDSKFIVGKTGSLSGTKSAKAESKIGNIDKLFSGVSYTTNYEFEKKITSAANANSALSDNMKKVTVKCYPFSAPKDSTQHKCSIANAITIKN